MKLTIDAGLAVCILAVGIMSTVFGNIKAGICLSGATASIYIVVASKTIRKRLQ